MPKAGKQAKTYLIVEFSKITGVYKDTIRSYQKKGLLPERRNPANNYRIFTDEDVETMRRIMAGEIVVPKTPKRKK